MSSSPSTIQKFRDSFVKYANSQGFSVPEQIKNANDFEFSIFVRNNLQPFRHDLNLAYSNMQSLMIMAGHELPQLSENQREKVKSYISAFIDCVE